MERLERGQALNQYFFQLLSDHNKRLIADGSTIIAKCQEIIDMGTKFEELIQGWDDSHPLMEAATKFAEYIEKKMQDVEQVSKTKE